MPWTLKSQIFDHMGGWRKHGVWSGFGNSHRGTFLLKKLGFIWQTNI